MQTNKSIKSQDQRHDKYVAATGRLEAAEANLKKIHSEMKKAKEDFAQPGARKFVDKSEGLFEATNEVGVARTALLKIVNN